MSDESRLTYLELLRDADPDALEDLNLEDLRAANRKAIDSRIRTHRADLRARASEDVTASAAQVVAAIQVDVEDSPPSSPRDEEAARASSRTYMTPEVVGLS